MRLEHCENCEHLHEERCRRKDKPIAQIRGCSLCPSGKMFFRAKCGKEAYRLKALGKKRGAKP